LENISQRFDVVYDTAAAMTTAVGLAMLRDGGVFLDINPTLGKFMRSMFDKRLKPIICKARADILDGLARAAAEGKLRLPVAAPVPLSDAMRLLHELEQGRKLAGKGLVVMD
jgi:NADPH:quinone reductase-like Zn-dependent oxidoreductase